MKIITIENPAWYSGKPKPVSTSDLILRKPLIFHQNYKVRGCGYFFDGIYGYVGKSSCVKDGWSWFLQRLVGAAIYKCWYEATHEPPSWWVNRGRKWNGRWKTILDAKIAN